MKLADALDVPVDYPLGKERFGEYDKETVERLQEIQNLDDNNRQTLFLSLTLLFAMLRLELLMLNFNN